MMTAIDKLNLLDIQLKNLHKQISEGMRLLAEESNFTSMSDTEFRYLVAQITNPQIRQDIMQYRYLCGLYGRETEI
jgi:hypothetical protein